MKTRIILAAAVAATLGCAQNKDPERDARQDGGTESKPEDTAPRTTAQQGDGQAENTRAPAAEGRPELATSPEALLLPAGPRLIQEALAERGYLAKDHRSGDLDVETSTALRKFQADEELARTGYPDRETVRRLGLTIAEVFKATGEGNEDPERK